MRNKKYSFRMYTAWDYEDEIYDLNKESEKGWQLIKGGCFHSLFEKDTGIRYRYQLDYNVDIDNRMRYIDTFKEQGWEYVNSTFNGWHYFRKIYDSALNEDDYKIYTETSGLPDARSRWIKIAKVLLALLCIFFLVFAVSMFISPELTRLPILVEYLTLALIIGNGIRKMYKTDRKRSWFNGRHVVGLILLTMIICTFASTKLNALRPNMEMSCKSDKNTVLESKDLLPDVKFDIKYSDYYYFDVDIECIDAINFIVIDNYGKTVLSKACSNNKISIENEKVYLKPGEYKVLLQINSLNCGHYDVKWSID